MTVTRRKLLWACAASAGLPQTGLARDTPMREAVDLKQSAQSSAGPMALLFSIKGCPFCEFVRKSYLLPMNREGIVNAWQVSIDRAGTLVAFDGSVQAPRAWAGQLNVRQTPTLMFLSGQGNSVAEPLIGVVSSEFYGAMLEQRIASARDGLKKLAP